MWGSWRFAATRRELRLQFWEPQLLVWEPQAPPVLCLGILRVGDGATSSGPNQGDGSPAPLAHLGPVATKSGLAGSLAPGFLLSGECDRAQTKAPRPLGTRRLQPMGKRLAPTSRRDDSASRRHDSSIPTRCRTRRRLSHSRRPASWSSAHRKSTNEDCR